MEQGKEQIPSIKYNNEFGEVRFYLGQTYIKLKNKGMVKRELKKAKELFFYQINEIDRKINDLKVKGWLKKIEKLEKKKKDLQEKLFSCETFLKKLNKKIYKLIAPLTLKNNNSWREIYLPVDFRFLKC